jgi:hypothetical protein
MNDRRARRDDLPVNARVDDAAAVVGALVERMQRAQAEVHRTIMLSNAQRADALERRIVTEDAAARRDDRRR